MYTLHSAFNMAEHKSDATQDAVVWTCPVCTHEHTLSALSLLFANERWTVHCNECQTQAEYALVKEPRPPAPAPPVRYFPEFCITCGFDDAVYRSWGIGITVVARCLRCSPVK